jgi:hypothetical protein
VVNNLSSSTRRPKGAYLMNVGTIPRAKAPKPSFCSTCRTQSTVEAYFRPVEALNPSVCIRVLITSIGYMQHHN